MTCSRHRLLLVELINLARASVWALTVDESRVSLNDFDKME